MYKSSKELALARNKGQWEAASRAVQTQKREKFTRVNAGEEGCITLTGDNSNTLVVELVRL